MNKVYVAVVQVCGMAEFVLLTDNQSHLFVFVHLITSVYIFINRGTWWHSG